MILDWKNKDKESDFKKPIIQSNFIFIVINSEIATTNNLICFLMFIYLVIIFDFGSLIDFTNLKIQYNCKWRTLLIVKNGPISLPTPLIWNLSQQKTFSSRKKNKRLLSLVDWDHIFHPHKKIINSNNPQNARTALIDLS